MPLFGHTARVQKQGWHYSTVRYGTPQFLLRSTVRWYGTPFFVKVRVRNVSTVFELKIPKFLHIAREFFMQVQKTAEADAKCVN